MTTAPSEHEAAAPEVDGEPGHPDEPTSDTSTGGTATGTGADEVPPSGRLSRRGRWLRALVTLVGAASLLAGTLEGHDDDFPFGPFKMYAHAARTDGTVRSARLEAVNVDGERFKLTDAATGLRRAEMEGQMSRFRQDGSRLEAYAEAYENRNPDAPALVLVEILQRRYELVDGEQTGEVTEIQVAYWVARGHEDLADYESRVEDE